MIYIPSLSGSRTGTGERDHDPQEVGPKLVQSSTRRWRNWQTRWIQVSVAPSQDTQTAAKQGRSESAADETLPPKSSGATSGPLAPNPRAGALADLQRRQQEAIEAGDLDLARALHGMIGMLLGGPTSVSAEVVDIATRRRER